MVTVATIAGDVWMEGGESARIFWAANVALGMVGIVAVHTGGPIHTFYHVPPDQAAQARLALQSFVEREKTDLLAVVAE
jgi:hypothetical protein